MIQLTKKFLMLTAGCTQPLTFLKTLRYSKNWLYTNIFSSHFFSCELSILSSPEGCTTFSASKLSNLKLAQTFNPLTLSINQSLFCICINPYKWLNVYTQIMRDFYRNKRRNEAPPHLYAIADGALQFLELGELHNYPVHPLLFCLVSPCLCFSASFYMWINWL